MHIAKLVVMAFIRIGVAEEVDVLIYQAAIKPVRVTKIVKLFKWGGRNASFCGEISNQFRVAPPKMAATLRIDVGYEHAKSSSLVA